MIKNLIAFGIVIKYFDHGAGIEKIRKEAGIYITINIDKYSAWKDEYWVIKHI